MWEVAMKGPAGRWKKGDRAPGHRAFLLEVIIEVFVLERSVLFFAC